MSETSDKELNIWKHFTKTEDDSEVECLTCKEVIQIENGDYEPLEKHLQGEEHQNSLKYMNKHRKMRNPLVWEHFTRTSQYLADCNHCKKTYNFRSTSHNLAQHLFKIHHIDIANISMRPMRVFEAERSDGARIRKRRRHTITSSKPIFLEEFDVDDGDDAAPSKSSDEDETRLVTSLSEFFEHEDGTSKCMVCDEQTENTEEDFHFHISREHPELLITKTPNSEIVLIKEEPRQSRRRRRRSFIKTTDHIKTHYETDKDHKEDELTHFSRYLTSLLRSLPKKVQNKLQMELLTAVMEAKMAGDTDGEKSCNPLDT